MEDLVAIEVATAEGPRCWFLTWGRIQDPVDPAPLEALILQLADHFALPGTPVAARVCGSLQEAREAPWFFEGLFDFAQKRIPFGDGYEEWRARIDGLMREGKEIYAAGPFSP